MSPATAVEERTPNSGLASRKPPTERHSIEPSRAGTLHGISSPARSAIPIRPSAPIMPKTPPEAMAMQSAYGNAAMARAAGTAETTLKTTPASVPATTQMPAVPVHAEKAPPSASLEKKEAGPTAIPPVPAAAEKLQVTPQASAATLATQA